jgi:FixJ family two-component response regulator
MTTALTHTAPIVFVVDEDISVREPLALLLRGEGWQVETFASAEEFLTRQRAPVPSCLVLNLSLPDLNGLDIQKRLASERPDLPMMFITGYDDVRTSVQAMKAGAVEFLVKPFEQDVLLNAIRECLDRSRVALAHEMEMRVLRNRYALLTQRERQIMGLVVLGLLNKQVAAELGISEITVKAHRGRVMQKMQAECFADLVKTAARLSPECARIRPVSSDWLGSRSRIANELQLVMAHHDGKLNQRNHHGRGEASLGNSLPG